MSDEDLEFPVVDLVLPMPLTLAGAIMKAVGEAAESEGYEAFFRKEDGMGRMHVRQLP